MPLISILLSCKFKSFIIGDINIHINIFPSFQDLFTDKCITIKFQNTLKEK